MTILRKRLWSIELPYEYDDWANSSWYGNFDYQNYGDLSVPGPSIRYLGAHHEYVDKSSDTNREYGEYSLKVNSVGWNNWINDQLERTARSSAGFLELDNQDHALERNRKAVLDIFNKMISMGIMPLLKNPTAQDIREFGGLKNADGHIRTAGCVFEAGELDPMNFERARKEVNPTLGGTWVRHGGSKDSAEIDSLRKWISRVPGTSVQWGPREYNGMRILASHPI